MAMRTLQQQFRISTYKAEGRKRSLAVPDSLVDDVALCGPKSRIAERLEIWKHSPVTTLNLVTTDVTTRANNGGIDSIARSDLGKLTVQSLEKEISNILWKVTCLAKESLDFLFATQYLGPAHLVDDILARV